MGVLFLGVVYPHSRKWLYHQLVNQFHFNQINNNEIKFKFPRFEIDIAGNLHSM